MCCVSEEAVVENTSMLIDSSVAAGQLRLPGPRFLNATPSSYCMIPAWPAGCISKVQIK